MTGEPLGAMLVRLREAKGYVQHQVAEQLCQLSKTPTVTRHEVSRWEREQRVPSDFWLGWLSQTFKVPVTELEEARERSRNTPASAVADPAGTNARECARPRKDNARALVTLKYEHRATSVQFNGTYEKPEQATAVIGMFREMVSPGMTAPVNGANGQASAARRSGASAANAGPRTPAPAAAAVRNGKPAPVQMGIRYPSGPGVAASGSDRTSANDGTWRKRRA